MTIHLPYPALVMLVGPSGSGKSTWAKKNFNWTEIVSSDTCREMISDTAEDMSVNGAAFDLYHSIIETRLNLRRLTVADATHLTKKARQKILDLGKKTGTPVIAMVFDVPVETCLAQNQQRARVVTEEVIRRHADQLVQVGQGLPAEGYRAIHLVASHDTVCVGPAGQVATGWDCVGDVHGCQEELSALLHTLGYKGDLLLGRPWYHPQGRRLAFVGDLTDRGPANVEVLSLVRDLVEDGVAVATLGNHCQKLYRALKGNKVQMAPGLQQTWQGLHAPRSPISPEEALSFLGSLPYQEILGVPGQEQRLVVAHAGLQRRDVGRTGNKAANSFCLYGESPGQGEDGYPIRTFNWLEDWTDGEYFLVYGHTVMPEPWFVHQTVNIDTGCVFGGALTAFRWPEREIVQVPAFQTYAER